DQANSPITGTQQRFRPLLAPSLIDPVHVAATGVNALFDFVGPNAALNNNGGTSLDRSSKVLLGVVVTLSVASLFVLGARGMVVAAGGDASEALRVPLQAGVPFPFYFSDGYEINRGNVGNW